MESLQAFDLRHGQYEGHLFPAATMKVDGGLL